VLLQPLKDGLVGTQLLDAETGKVLAESFLSLPTTLNDPQKIGGCVTYFRRYTLKSLLAIAEVDDDGNLASKPAPKKVLKPIDNTDFEFELEGKNDLKSIVKFATSFEMTDLQKKAITIKHKELSL
jgi:hypothetical protein